jgi:nitrite reductase/ring-hydroxylating ferredoxin subunit
MSSTDLVPPTAAPAEGTGHACPDRRCVLLGTAAAGAAAVLAGCSSYGNDPAPAASSAASSAAAAGSDAAASGGDQAAAGLAALADIPVGGGKIFADAKLVITQPTAGDVKAFSSVCTHQGCNVTEVTGGSIVCACHGRKFAIADGSVTAGPAKAPLASVGVAVKDGQIVKA